jgi:hypothetical protein
MDWGLFVHAGHYLVAGSGGAWRWSSRPSLACDSGAFLMLDDITERPLLDHEGAAEASGEEKREETRWWVHVAYSCAYASPVLFLSGSGPSGRPATLARTQSLFPVSSQVAPAEHPLLGRPCFSCHACGAARLAAALGADKNPETLLRSYVPRNFSCLFAFSGFTISSGGCRGWPLRVCCFLQYATLILSFLFFILSPFRCERWSGWQCR